MTRLFNSPRFELIIILLNLVFWVSFAQTLYYPLALVNRNNNLHERYYKTQRSILLAIYFC